MLARFVHSSFIGAHKPNHHLLRATFKLPAHLTPQLRIDVTVCHEFGGEIFLTTDYDSGNNDPDDASSPGDTGDPDSADDPDGDGDSAASAAASSAASPNANR